MNEERKHYCFLTGLYGRYDGLMFERQGKSLLDAGFDVSIVVCDEIPNEVKDGIKIISTGRAFKTRKDRFFNSKRLLLSYAKQLNADIYQISDPELMGLVRPLKKGGKKVVFNLREYYPDMIKGKYYIPKPFRNKASTLYSKYMKYYLAQYDAVFTVTDWILEIIKNEFEVTKSYLLTNYPRYNPHQNFSLEDYLSRDNILCYEGTVYRQSKQENVFKALDEILEIKYVIYGKIHQNYQHIKKLPYWKNVEFKDGFNLDELEQLFWRSTISNVFRDFGKRDGSLGVMKVFESMEAGLPVLFADVPLYHRINEQYKCGICVNPNSVDSIRNAILYLQNNKKEAYEMGQRGREAVRTEFNWEKQAKCFISIINHIIES